MHRSRPSKKNPKGRWAAYWRDSLNVQHSKSFDFKHEAQRFLDELVVERNGGMDHDPKSARITVAELGARWRTAGTRGGKPFKPATLRGYDSVLKTHVLPTFGRAYIGSVTRDDVEDWIVGLMAHGLKPSTVRNCCFVLRSMYRYALHPSRRWTRANPCHGVMLPQATTDEVRPLRPSDIAALADAVGDRYRVLVYFTGYTGLRAGEVGGLRVRHVDFLRNEVVVEDQVQWVKGGYVITTPKSSRSRRTIGVPGFVMEMLLAHLADRGNDPDAFIFCAYAQGRIDVGIPVPHQPMRHTSFLSRHFRRAVKAAGLPAATKFHHLRHTCSAMLLEAGTPVYEVSRHLGHSETRITEALYGHIYDTSRQRLAAALEAAYAGQAAAKVACVNDASISKGIS